MTAPAIQAERDYRALAEAFRVLFEIGRRLDAEGKLKPAPSPKKGPARAGKAA